MKNKFVYIMFGILIVTIGVTFFFEYKTNNVGHHVSEEKLSQLPKPEITGGIRGEQFGIDKNINEETIDNYLNREDSVYRDMRMLEDPGNYAAIGGDSMLSGYVKGFEVIPLPYIIPVTNLPKEVGETYKGKTLFSIDSKGNYIANYKESMDILEKHFPKDKYIFLMCGGGGYAGMMKNMLITLGWDQDKIYNVGGYWYYEGKNKVEVKKVVDGKTTYDFDSVPYINIDFTKLTELKNSNVTSNVTSNNNVTSNKVNSTTSSKNSNKTSNKNTISNTINLPITLTSKYYNVEHKDNKYFNSLDFEVLHGVCYELYENPEGTTDTDKLDSCLRQKDDETATKQANIINTAMKNKENFIVAVFPAETCMGSSGEEKDPQSFMVRYANDKKIFIYNIGTLTYKKTSLYNKKTKYVPIAIIVHNGKILEYTDANSDKYKKISTDYNAFKSWIKKYVKVK